MKQNWKQKTSLFLSSQAISLFGSALVQYAIIWYITLKTESGIMMTIATLCGFLPQVFISLFAGVWADRYNKKYLIMLADATIAIVTLVIAILFFVGVDSIWLLFVVLAIRSLGSGIQSPTVTSFVPEIAPEEQLMRVNGVNSTIQAFMLVVAPAASGALLANVSLEYIFFIDVITALIGIFLLSFVKVEKKKVVKEKGNYFTSIKEGVQYTKGHPLISRMLVYTVIANIFVAPFAILAPLYITRVFGSNPWFLTWNEIVFSVGNILGGVLISIWGGFKNRFQTVGVGCILCGVFCVLTGIPIHFVFFLFCMGLAGITVPLFNTPMLTIFQENVDKDKQGRVFSLLSILTGAVMPLSMVLYGPLADFIPIQWILIVTGILFVLMSVCLLRDKVFKKYQ